MLILYNYSGKKILILGMGLTGISCINFFLKKGITPKIIDESAHPIYLKTIPKKIKYHVGNLKKTWILESDIIVISPGISSNKPILKQAKKLGINVISDIELFSREVTVPIIAITGTNGKSTVATIVKKIAKRAGYNVSLCGNIGYPVLDTLEKKFNLHVIEISSFQLEHTFCLKPKIAVILNITHDHINRYPNGFKEYKKIKLSIYKQAEICINNNFNILDIPIKTSKQWISFGSIKSDYYILHHKNNTFLCNKGKKIINTNQMLLYGQHNYQNILAVLAIADSMTFPRSHTMDIIRTFSGLPHRLQIINTHKGICCINDSKSTNVSSVKAALTCLRSKGTIWLLLGGDKKNANFHVLKKYLKNMKVRIYCFGKDGVYLSKIYSKKSIYTPTLKQAVSLISKKVVSGDTVLLSPGCSSLDQFPNFEERGNQFIQFVRDLI